MGQVGAQDMEEVQQVVLKGLWRPFQALSLLLEIVVLGGGDPLHVEEGDIRRVPLHVLLKVDFPASHGELGLLVGEGPGWGEL